MGYLYDRSLDITDGIIAIRFSPDGRPWHSVATTTLSACGTSLALTQKSLDNTV